MDKSALLIIILFLSGQLLYAHEGHHHAGQVQNPEKENVKSSQQEIYTKINESYQKQVKPIFERKCAACHSSQVKAPGYASIPGIHWIVESDRSEAKEHLEISKGFPFAGHGTPKEDLEAIAKVTKENSMPTFLYRLVHPSSKLTEQEKTAIHIWIQKSAQLLD